jgi:hypothetical protein
MPYDEDDLNEIRENDDRSFKREVRHVEAEAASEDPARIRTFDRQKGIVGDLNRALKRAKLYPTKKEFELGYWAVQSGEEGGWSTEPRPGNSRIVLWHRLPNGWGDPRRPTSGGLFGVATQDLGGYPVDEESAYRLILIIDGLRGTRKERLEQLGNITLAIGYARNEALEAEDRLRRE